MVSGNGLYSRRTNSRLGGGRGSGSRGGGESELYLTLLCHHMLALLLFDDELIGSGVGVGGRCREVFSS